MDQYIPYTLVLFLMLILLMGKKVEMKPTGINRQDRVWRMKMTACENEDCGHLVPETAYNCVNQCVSPSCFESVYSKEPLEDGEIDSFRNREFFQCVRKEYRGKVNSSRNLFRSFFPSFLSLLSLRETRTIRKDFSLNIFFCIKCIL